MEGTFNTQLGAVWAAPPLDKILGPQRRKWDAASRAHEAALASLARAHARCSEMGKARAAPPVVTSGLEFATGARVTMQECRRAAGTASGSTVHRGRRFIYADRSRFVGAAGEGRRKLQA